MKIIWFSRHKPLPSQKDELEKMYGKIELVIDPLPFSSADDIIERFKKADGDEIVVVAPLSVLSQLCDRGLKPLWAEMQVVPSEEAEVVANGRGYRFIRFRRVKRVALEFEDDRGDSNGKI